MDTSDDTLPCGDKIAFDSLEAAEVTATTSDYWYGQRPHAYRCRYCDLWHLSSNSA